MIFLFFFSCYAGKQSISTNQIHEIVLTYILYFKISNIKQIRKLTKFKKNYIFIHNSFRF